MPIMIRAVLMPPCVTSTMTKKSMAVRKLQPKLHTMTTRLQSCKPRAPARVDLPVLPDELWTTIISFLKHSALLAMSDTCALFKSLISNPTSNLWSKTLAIHQQNSTIASDITISQILRNFAVIHKTKQMDRSCTTLTPFECLQLFSTTHCQYCPTKTVNIYLAFNSRLCDICVHQYSISESALIHIAGEDYIDGLPHEHLGVLVDLHGCCLDSVGEPHYWNETVTEDLGFDVLKDEDGFFEELDCSSHHHYIGRKNEALEELRSAL